MQTTSLKVITEHGHLRVVQIGDEMELQTYDHFADEWHEKWTVDNTAEGIESILAGLRAEADACRLICADLATRMRRPRR